MIHVGTAIIVRRPMNTTHMSIATEIHPKTFFGDILNGLQTQIVRLILGWNLTETEQQLRNSIYFLGNDL